MVNTKGVAFKVNRQEVNQNSTPQPIGTVINCRKPRNGLSRKGDDIKSSQVPLTGFGESQPRPPKRKRPVIEDCDEHGAITPTETHSNASVDGQQASTESRPLPRRPFPVQNPRRPLPRRPFPVQNPRLPKLKPFRKGRTVETELDPHCWRNILEFMEPSQLFSLRPEIKFVYNWLKDYPSIWKTNRKNTHCDNLPDPPESLSEFQYADLLYGSGCMSCGKSARKAYWAFLRRWCKPCMEARIIKEDEALQYVKMAFVKKPTVDEAQLLQKCLPSAFIDSWGNFMGVAPASGHSFKVVYLSSDVDNLIADYHTESQKNRATWHIEVRAWMNKRSHVVSALQEFSRRVEAWEDSGRASKSFEYQQKKEARKRYFTSRALELAPPITPEEIEKLPSYKRAITIPKNPHNTSWTHLRPKLEREVAELRTRSGFFQPSASELSSRTATLTPGDEDMGGGEDSMLTPEESMGLEEEEPLDMAAYIYTAMGRGGSIQPLHNAAKPTHFS